MRKLLPGVDLLFVGCLSHRQAPLSLDLRRDDDTNSTANQTKEFARWLAVWAEMITDVSRQIIPKTLTVSKITETNFAELINSKNRMIRMKLQLLQMIQDFYRRLTAVHTSKHSYKILQTCWTPWSTRETRGLWTHSDTQGTAQKSPCVNTF